MKRQNPLCYTHATLTFLQGLIKEIGHCECLCGPHYHAGAEAQWLCMCAPRHHYAVSLSLDAINLSSFLLSNLLLVQSVSAYHFSSVKQVNTILLILDEKQNSKTLATQKKHAFRKHSYPLLHLQMYVANFICCLRLQACTWLILANISRVKRQSSQNAQRSN